MPLASVTLGLLLLSCLDTLHYVLSGHQACSLTFVPHLPVTCSYTLTNITGSVIGPEQVSYDSSPVLSTLLPHPRANNC